MDEIAIVRRRSRFWPALLMVLVLLALALGALWVFGDWSGTPGFQDASGIRLEGLELQAHA